MTKNNKVRRITAYALVLIGVAVAAVAVMEARQPFGPRGPRMGQGRGPGGMGPFMEMGRGLRGLEVSDAQRDQIRALMQGHQAEFEALRERAFTAHRALQAAITAETVNEATIRQASAAVAVVDADEAVLRARVHAEIFQVLTPEQRQKAREHRTAMQQRMEERRKLRQ